MSGWKSGQYPAIPNQAACADVANQVDNLSMSATRFIQTLLLAGRSAPSLKATARIVELLKYFTKYLLLGCFLMDEQKLYVSCELCEFVSCIGIFQRIQIQFILYLYSSKPQWQKKSKFLMSSVGSLDQTHDMTSRSPVWATEDEHQRALSLHIE